MGKKLLSMAEEDGRICAVTAAMCESTGLSPIKERFPERFFDVGIAEEHAVTMAAGLAIGKTVPVVCVYSTFLQRAYDQIIHDVCLSNLHVVFCIDRSGIVGEDGETHQGIFDISYLSHIPNMTVLAPTCYEELSEMLKYAVYEAKGPVAVKYPRGEISLRKTAKEFTFGKSSVIKKGKDVTIVAVGNMLETAVKAAEYLEEKNISTTVINALCVKPIDTQTVIENTDKYLFTIEDNVITGGFGANLKQKIDFGKYVKIKNYGWDDRFVPHGKCDVLYEKSGLDYKSIAEDILTILKGDK
jgi:1-deoxy-D-xylulose-5-phosphate synthase